MRRSDYPARASNTSSTICARWPKRWTKTRNVWTVLSAMTRSMLWQASTI